MSGIATKWAAEIEAQGRKAGRAAMVLIACRPNRSLSDMRDEFEHIAQAHLEANYTRGEDWQEAYELASCAMFAEACPYALDAEQKAFDRKLVTAREAYIRWHADAIGARPVEVA